MIKSFKIQLRYENNPDTASRVCLRPNWCVIRYSHVQDEKDRKALRGRWCKITGPHGSTCRLLRFGGADLAENRIVIDWHAWSDLCEGKREDAVELHFECLPWWKTIWSPMKQTDPVGALAYKLGLVSVALGLIGFLLGVLSLVIAVELI